MSPTQRGTPRRGPRPGEYWRGFQILAYLPERCGSVVEALCPAGHSCVGFLYSLSCGSCAEAPPQQRYSRIYEARAV
jgi:hypothetical protein